MKKRVFAVLLAVMLLVASFSTAMAATAGISAPATVEQGEKITVTITMPALEGVKAATIETKVAYDTTKVELVEYTAAEVTGQSNMSSTVEEANAAGSFTGTIVSPSGENTVDMGKDLVWTAVFEAAKGVTEATFTVETFYAEGLEEDGFTGIPYYGEEDSAKSVTVKINVPCEHNWEETAAKVEPKCGVAGKEAVYTCSICGATKGGEEIKALEHKWEVKEEVASTCKDAGYVTKKCALCGEEVTTTLELADHTWGEWTLDEEGTTETRTCEVCGATESREYNPETGDTMMSVLFLAMAATFVVAIAKVNKARKDA